MNTVRVVSVSDPEPGTAPWPDLRVSARSRDGGLGAFRYRVRGDLRPETGDWWEAEPDGSLLRPLLKPPPDP